MFWAAPFERNGEFGGRGWPASFPASALTPITKGGARENTTLVVIATDAILTKAQAKRVAVMAQSGLSRAIYPVHTPLDGDVVFAASTGRRPLADPLLGLTTLGAIAANVVARAIARGVYAGQSAAICPARCRAGRTNSDGNSMPLRVPSTMSRAAETTTIIFRRR